MAPGPNSWRAFPGMDREKKTTSDQRNDLWFALGFTAAITLMGFGLTLMELHHILVGG